KLFAKKRCPGGEPGTDQQGARYSLSAWPCSALRGLLSLTRFAGGERLALKLFFGRDHGALYLRCCRSSSRPSRASAGLAGRAVLVGLYPTMQVVLLARREDA